MKLSEQFDGNYSDLRHEREIVISPEYKKGQPIAAFVGVYNAEAYLDSLLEQLESQLEKNVAYLVVDNHSTDKTWSILQTWVDKFPMILARNPTNVGATGSLYLNIDLVDSPWVTFVHQDDYYMPNHLGVLLESIRDLDDSYISVSTEMGSLHNDGNVMPSPPRASWLLKDENIESHFLANVRLQTVPWPATAFKSRALLEVASPWHSSSFQDTEMMLQLAMMGKSRYVPIQTMRYRENPDSGSHELDLMERTVGAGLSLLRIFASDRFRLFIQKIDVRDRADFARSLTLAIRARLAGSELCDLIQLQAAEVMQFGWGYQVRELNSLVASGYGAMGAKRTVEFLGTLDFARGKGLGPNEVREFFAFTPRFEKYSISEKSPSVESLDFGIRMFSRLPYRIKRALFPLLARLVLRNNSVHPWNFSWKTRR